MLAVPALVGRPVAQAKVGGQVDDAHAALEQRGDDGRGRAVRVGDDRRVDVAVDVEVELLEDGVDAMVGIELAQRPADVAAARDGGQREARVAVDEPRRDRARIARAARDEDARVSHATRLPEPLRPPAAKAVRAAQPRSSPPRSLASRATIFSRTGATSASVSVRSFARNVSAIASDVRPAAICSPR